MSQQTTPSSSTSRRVSVVAVALVAAGAVALALSLFVLEYTSTRSVDFKFRELHDLADLADLGGLAGAWFAWLAYATAAAAVLTGALSLIPGAAQSTIRVVATIIGVGGIVIAFVALADNDRGIKIGDRGIGFWVGMAGLALVVAGSLVPSRPVVTYLPNYGMPTHQDRFANPSQQYPPSQQGIGGQSYGAVPPAATAAWAANPVAPASFAPATAPVAPAVPPGWHPDPTGRNEQRWWDGQAWTADVVRAGVQANDPM